MPTYKYVFPVTSPGLFDGGYVGTVNLGIGRSNIASVAAGLTSGEADFNFTFDSVDSSDFTITDFDDFGSDLLWHLRAEDLGTAYANGNSITEFWSYLPIEHRFMQNDSSIRPSYFSQSYGINNSLGTLNNPSLHFSGVPNDHMLNHDNGGTTTEGTFELDGTASFTIVVVCGTKSAGSYRPFIGEQSSGSIGTVYGDWGRYRVRQKAFYEYTHSSALAAANQIRVCTIDNTSQTASNVTDHINGTKTVDSSMSIDRQNPWKFTMLGGFEYVTSGNTYRTLWGGGLTEIMLFDGALTTSERELVEGYLAHKYDVEVYLPTGHTYKSTDPNPSLPTFEMTTDASLGTATSTIKTYSPVKQVNHGQVVHLYMPRAQNPGLLNFAVTTS